MSVRGEDHVTHLPSVQNAKSELGAVLEAVSYDMRAERKNANYRLKMTARTRSSASSKSGRRRNLSVSENEMKLDLEEASLFSEEEVEQSKKVKPARQKRRQKTQTNEEGETVIEQGHFSYVGPFWRNISDYVGPLTKADLEFFAVDKQGLPSDSIYLQIPPLGTHYKEVWFQEDQTNGTGDRSSLLRLEGSNIN